MKRWHLTFSEQRRICELRKRRLSLTAIARITKIGRLSIVRCLKKHGLPTGHLPDPEQEILKLLRQNIDRKEVAKKLHCSLRAVRRVGKKYKTKQKRDPLKGKLVPIDERIRARRHAIHIARELRLPYRRILDRAHEIFGPGKFIGGLTSKAYLSYEPQLQERIVQSVTKVPNSLPMTDGPFQIFSPEDALFFVDLALRSRQMELPDDFIGFAEGLANFCLQTIMQEAHEWWDELSAPDRSIVEHTLHIEMLTAANTIRTMPETTRRAS
jgi:hypothetical protein